MNPKLCPAVMIIIDIAAAISYIAAKDWRHIVYWVAAAALNFVVTF